MSNTARGYITTEAVSNVLRNAISHTCESSYKNKSKSPLKETNLTSNKNKVTDQSIAEICEFIEEISPRSGGIFALIYFLDSNFTDLCIK